MSPNNYSIPINKWSKDDRPREKLRSKGKENLSNSELLAILIGSGSKNESAVAVCQKILSFASNDLNKLSMLSINELKSFKGIGEAKAITIQAALELGKRRKAKLLDSDVKIKSSETVFDVMHPILGELPHEEFWVIYLNNSNKIIEKQQLSKGGITGTLVDVRLILKVALQLGAIAIILCHNHPSGSLQASKADKQITLKISNACKGLDIKLLDHIVVTNTTYLSFADNGMI